MKIPSPVKQSIEILEQRIAPAGLLNEAGFKTASVGTPFVLNAGEGLSTGGPKAGTYLLYVEKGTARIFTTDYNLNGAIDYNEITGIAAGDGLRLISFVDIHGDIVTNLNPDTSLSDSDRNSTNDDPSLGGDGKVLLNSTIEKIELRSLTTADIDDQDGLGAVGPNGQIVPDQNDVNLRLALSSYSVHGNILAGKGFGLVNDTTSGLLIDATGKGAQQAFFTGGDGSSYRQDELFIDFKPTIGSIKTGTAATGTYFTFGASRADGTLDPVTGNPAFGIAYGDDVQGRIVTFAPAVNQVGGDISNVRASDATTVFNLDSLEAGGGGVNARGGNINNAQLNGDDAGGYRIIAGNGGRGTNGGAGGAIVTLSDFGSVTGSVLIQTGDGGAATTGAGGPGGNLSFGTINLNGGVVVKLGNGGDGFTAGGNGATLTNGTFTTPNGAVPFGVNVVANSTSSIPGQVGTVESIGTTIPVDFDENGLGDLLFTSDDPNQLIVVLDGDNTLRISLDGPVTAEAVAVADFNDDGHQDIAAASSDPGDFAGVSVFLAKYEDLNGDGTLTGSEDLNGNGIDDFLGFYSPIHSTLPALNSNVVPIVAQGVSLPFHRSANAIGGLVAGDFDADGFNELAVISTYYFGANDNPVQVLQYLTPDFEFDAVRGEVPTGQFFVDVGIKAPPGGTTTFFSPFIALDAGDTGTTIIKGTGGASASGNDVIFTAALGAKKVMTYEYDFPDAAGPLLIGVWDLGRVDTDRLPERGNTDHINLEFATVRDFTLVDVDSDLNADLVVLTEAPSADFIVGIFGDGAGAPDATRPKFSDADSTAPGAPPDAGDNQNAGIALADLSPESNTLDIGSPFAAIVTTDVLEFDTDADGIADASDGLKDDVALLEFTSNPGRIGRVVELVFVPRVDSDADGADPTIVPSTGLLANLLDPTVVAFDAYTADLGVPEDVGYAVAKPTKSEIAPLQIDLIGLPVSPVFPFGRAVLPLTENGVDVTAGNGGDALVGRGGIGGSIGGGIKIATDPVTGLQTVDGALDITFTSNRAFRGTSVLAGGDGGNGFSTGGAGGNVNGVTLRTPGLLGGAAVFLTGGDGGFGVSGAGGAGGDLKGNSIQDGLSFIAGNGGRGQIGGAGGDVLGNGLKNTYDTQVGDLFVQGGDGGAGVRAGGAGGVINNFRPSFNIGPGSLTYVGGNGGSSISSTGGSGGSITNNSPLTSVNLLSGEIFVAAGNGGSGRTGGVGGSVVTFDNRPSTQDNPIGVSFLGGAGGAGKAGNGGAGGAVRDIFSPSIGQGFFGFNRILGGDGGNSASASGGAGGSVSDLEQVGATNGSLAIAAGAGGTGLRGGGLGGSVLNSTTTVGGSPAAKLLVIAGKGGDVTSVIFNPNDTSPNNAQKVFGGKMGKAGNGGSIVNLAQELGTAAKIDLIAGNGGDTINFGTISPTETTFVGNGGSIRNIRAVGNIGNSDPFVPLLSYNNTADLNNDGLADQTVAQFVDATLRNGGAGGTLDDSIGSVGIIVGTAGRLKTIQTGTGPGGGPIFSTQPSNTGINGSLLDVNALSLSSAVAGSIDRVAAIQLVSGLRIGFQNPGPGGAFTPASVGADKDVVGVFEYFDAQGNPSVTPVADGRLQDGAVFARKVVIKSGDPNLTGRVFA